MVLIIKAADGVKVHTPCGGALFIKYFNCHCCLRHQVNKPAWIQAGWIETECKQSVYKKSEFLECECDCRHELRWMARRENPLPKTPKTPTTLDI